MRKGLEAAEGGKAGFALYRGGGSGRRGSPLREKKARVRGLLAVAYFKITVLEK